MEHFFSLNSGENQKEKKVFEPKKEHFFPRIQMDTYAQMHTRAKLLGRVQMYTIQFSNYWGDTAKLLRGYISPPPGFGCWQ